MDLCDEGDAMNPSTRPAVDPPHDRSPVATEPPRTASAGRVAPLLRPLLSVLIALAACGGTIDTPPEPEPGAVVLHDNLMAFLQAPPPSWQPNPPVQPRLQLGFAFTGDYIVSDGQPWQGVKVSGGAPGTPLEITALAGRHKTAPPATWLDDRSQLVLGYGLLDDRPAELNFAFAGNLLIDGSSYPIVLGQGSDLLGDDWWLGVPASPDDGPPWTQDASGYLHTPDGKYVVCPKDGGYFGAHDNAFQVITPDLTVNCEEA